MVFSLFNPLLRICIDSDCEVVVRCGKLTMGSEETNTVQSIKKSHTNLGIELYRK